MAVELAVVSLVCAVFLAVFISVQRIRTSVPRLAIILWLFVYNLVHGINALVWSGNVDIHALVWCDIVTNLMLGANLALPAALFCISRQLELLSSTRTISSHPTAMRNRLMLDIFMCYILPILYMLLHLLVQDHRFDLVENLGCSASVDPSALGFSLIWIPPLLISIMCIMFFALSIRNSRHHARFVTHLESRSLMTYWSFLRRLIISMTTVTAASLFYIVSLFSGPRFHPWSWTAVHATMSEVHIVSSQDEIRSIQLAWWGGFVVSVLYLLLSFCLGEETQDIFQWIKKHIRERRFILPFHFSKNASALHVPSPNTRPLTVEYKSGWDEMLHTKVPKAKKNAGKTSSLMISTSSSSTPTISTVVTDDGAFMGSATVKTLGLSGLPVPRSTFEIPSKTRTPLSPTSPKVTESIRLSPPNSPLPNLPESSRPGPSSPAACPEEMYIQPRYPTPSPHRGREALGHDWACD